MRQSQSLSDSEFRWCLEQVPVLRAWCNLLEAEALSRLASDIPVPGFKLVEGRANRIFSNPEATKKLLLKLKLSEDDIAPRSLVSPAQLEKLLKKTKKLFLWDKIKPMVDKPKGKLAIAPETDARPAVTRGQEFAQVTEDEVDGNEI